MYDYHPKSVPAPYNHSNIDSDEVLYYVDGDFMSRNNIEQDTSHYTQKVFRTDQLQEQWEQYWSHRYRIGRNGRYLPTVNGYRGSHGTWRWSVL
jgi:hypothetical protein